jgi:hypothetical protein
MRDAYGEEPAEEASHHRCARDLEGFDQNADSSASPQAFGRRVDLVAKYRILEAFGMCGLTLKLFRRSKILRECAPSLHHEVARRGVSNETMRRYWLSRSSQSKQKYAPLPRVVERRAIVHTTDTAPALQLQTEPE